MARADLHPDFRAFLESLNSANVRYLVLGGYAVIHYGYRRVTDDLDIWIAIDPENARRVSEVLQTFGGFPPAKVKPSMFQVEGRVFAFGREPVRVDLLTSPTAVEFETCYARRNVVSWDGIAVPLISFEDLKANKLGSGRAKDLTDIENLPSVWPRPAGPRKRGGRRPK